MTEEPQRPLSVRDERFAAIQDEALRQPRCGARFTDLASL